LQEDYNPVRTALNDQSPARYFTVRFDTEAAATVLRHSLWLGPRLCNS